MVPTSTTVFMEGISQCNMVLEHQLLNAPKVVGRHATVAREPNARF
jgi:hypothetical protein